MTALVLKVKLDKAAAGINSVLLPSKFTRLGNYTGGSESDQRNSHHFMLTSLAIASNCVG